MAAAGGTVGLVFVSHSTKIADGLVDLARQMAPRTRMIPAGGTDDGGIGTSFEKVLSGIEQADAGDGVVLLCDLGSAILTAETALDFLDDAVRARVRIVDAPLVEGGVAAAVAAEIGGDLESVVRAARSAAEGVPAAPVDPASPPLVTRTVTLVNKDGLHARPAADFVKLASTFTARVTVNGKDASSLLAVMSLGLIRGMTAEISSSDENGAEAVAALGDLLESGFGEE
ncbi:HPr family phosphocarrier protein [Cryobacterium cheniae]|uniref:Phosphocarrier protein HPr n=1 Tax=Cryobacterium cheniae TaxID=1259262 RepID=A0A4R8XLL3_9MICO|nr:dihydroxyacetone kinase phosphoryl donor subunit DhaM [Cryobacterium cheniae]TFC79548.1 HPr family phosphocarrier protein [Cryobacterium cheniae]